MIKKSECKTLEDKLEYLKQEFGPGSSYSRPWIVKTLDEALDRLSENLEIPVSLGLDDVAILQNKNICRSRLDVDTKSEVFRGVTLEVPLLAANMLSVVDSDFCIKLYNLGNISSTLAIIL